MLPIREQKDGLVAAADSRSLIVNTLELSATTNPLPWAKLQSLFVTDRQALSPLRSAPFQHEAAVLRAHAHQEAVRPRAVARIGLERPFPLHALPSESTKLSIVSERFGGCQSARELCYSLRPFGSVLSPVTACWFGLHTKFSTTVEKPVENR